MFDNFLMSMNSKLKKIMSGLETNEGKIDEISTDVDSITSTLSTVNTNISNATTDVASIKTAVEELDANINNIKNTIDSTKEYTYTTSSSNVLLTVLNSQISDQSSSGITVSDAWFVTRGSGTITLKASLKYTNTSGMSKTGFGSELTVYKTSKDGSITDNLCLTLTGTTESYVSHTGSISVADGDKFTFKLRSKSPSYVSAQCKLIQVLGVRSDIDTSKYI